MFKLIIGIILFIAAFVGKTIIGNVKYEEQKVSELQGAMQSVGEMIKESYQERIDSFHETISQRKKFSSLWMSIGLILSVICIAIAFIAIVPTGYTGIKTTFGRVEQETLDAGLRPIFPWQDVVLMDNRTQKEEFATQAFSSDIQQVDIKLSINYSIDKTVAQHLYQTVGVNYYDRVMLPRIQENTKAVFSQYTAESLIENRNVLSMQIAAATTADMKQYGIVIESISAEDIDFTDAFTDAVEAKQVAAQRKLTAETEQAQKTMEEKAIAERAIIAENAKAEQAVIAAKADLEVVQIQAEASLYAGQREAEMNQRIAEALTGELLDYYWIKQWDGELPNTMLGNEPAIMLTLGADEED